MKKILYCMHIGWNWIKQRPHYLAEQLADDYDVTVISDYNYRIKGKKIKSKQNLHIHNFYKIPKIDNNSKLYIINNWLRKSYYFIYIKRLQPDYIYVMTPNALKCIPYHFRGKIIYDCMDDMIEFTENPERRIQIQDQECELIQKSFITFVSSRHLMETLLMRYPEIKKDKYVLVRNGYNGFISNENFTYEKTQEYTLCYFGTIAEWFNFEYILSSLDDIPNLRYLIIGPLQTGTTVPTHPRLKYVGPVEHNKLGEITEKVNGFIMPFKVSALIESVDPVKLYEYINFNKNIICVEYPEVERFADFVFFYKDYKSFVEQILIMMQRTDCKYSNDTRVSFLNSNNWKCRADDIKRVLNQDIKR